MPCTPEQLQCLKVLADSRADIPCVKSIIVQLYPCWQSELPELLEVYEGLIAPLRFLDRRKGLTQYLYPYERKYVEDPNKPGSHLLCWEKKPSFQDIPDKLLMCGGNQKELQTYLDQHPSMPDDARQFLQTRIASEEALSNAKRGRQRALYEGKPPKPMDVIAGADFVGLDLKLSGSQTSQNGCWSTAVLLMMESRGVDMTQEQIRAFRPRWKSWQRWQNLEGDTFNNFNMDTFSSVQERADVILEALPNTAVDTLTFRPIHWKNLTWQGKMWDAMDQGEQGQLKDFLVNQYCEAVTDTIRKAIEKHHSPVALTAGDHVVTVTGIDSEGQLCFEDSNSTDRILSNQFTRQWSVKELLNSTIFNSKPDSQRKKSLALSWIRDIEMPDISQKNVPIKPCGEDSSVAAKVAYDGEVELSGHGGAWSDCNWGRCAGTPVASDKNLDRVALQRYGITNYDNTNIVTIGTLESYIPNKLYYQHDPLLAKELNLDVQNPQNLHLPKGGQSVSQVPANKQAGQQQPPVITAAKREPMDNTRKKNQLSSKVAPTSGNSPRPIYVYDSVQGTVFKLEKNGYLEKKGEQWQVKAGAPLRSNSSGEVCTAAEGLYIAPEKRQIYFPSKSDSKRLYSVDIKDLNQVRVNNSEVVGVFLPAGRKMGVTTYILGQDNKLETTQGAINLEAARYRSCRELKKHPVWQRLQAKQAAVQRSKQSYAPPKQAYKDNQSPRVVVNNQPPKNQPPRVVVRKIPSTVTQGVKNQNYNQYSQGRQAYPVQGYQGYQGYQSDPMHRGFM